MSRKPADVLYAALGNAEIIQGRDAGKRIDREHEVMNQAGAVDRVLAVIAGVMVAAGYVDGSLIDERKELRGRARERGGNLRWVVRVERVGVAGDRGPGKGIGRRRGGHTGRRGVAFVMNKARVGQCRVGAAALMIKAQGVGAGKGHSQSRIDREGQRSAQDRHHQAILAGRVEAREIRLINALVRRRVVGVTDVRSLRECSLKYLRAGGRVHQVEAAARRNRHLAQATRVIPNHGLLGEIGHVTLLIHMNGRAEPQGINRRRERRSRRPERAVQVLHLDCLIVGERLRQLQIERVLDAQIVLRHRCIQRAAFESDRGDRNGLAIGRHDKVSRQRRGQLGEAVDQVPLPHRRRIGRLGGD